MGGPPVPVTCMETARSPDATDTECIQLRVNAENRNIHGERLRGDHAIEGITVSAREPARSQGVFGTLRVSGDSQTFGDYLLGFPLQDSCLGEPA